MIHQPLLALPSHHPVWKILTQGSVSTEAMHLDLVYPRNQGHVECVEVGLTDVRSADSVRLSYDFVRDGWKVEQERSVRKEWGEVLSLGWEEVGFFESRALQHDEEDNGPLPVMSREHFLEF